MNTNRKKLVTFPLRAAVAAAIFGTGTFRVADGNFRSGWEHRRRARPVPTATTYRVTDRLHEGRTVYVSCHEIVTTVSTWLAELGTHSLLVEDLARAVDAGDWPVAYAICDRLSVDVTSWT
jgi:hypothetical protein